MARGFCCILFLALGLVFVQADGAVLAGDASTTEATAKAGWILVLKSERRLLLIDDGRVLFSFQVALGREPWGPKTRQGDGRTPEGVYMIDGRNPDSPYYRSLHISYPNSDDLARIRDPKDSPGGEIVIHGLPPELEIIGEAHTRLDWTEGCIAVTNREMDILWAAIGDGTVIEIRP